LPPGAERAMCDRHGLGRLVQSVWADPPAGRDEASAPPSGPAHVAPPRRRRKLWELEAKYLCPVVGTCLTLEEIKRVARKDGFPGTGFDAYRLHVEAVSVAGSRNTASEILHKTLERKHARPVKAFETAKDDGAVAALWRRHLEEGQVAGAFWAVMTHKAASPETRAQAYGDVHMLSHQVGSGLAADARRLAFLEGEVPRLARQARQEHDRLNQELAQRATRIRFLEAEVQRQQAQARELAELRQRLSELESGQVVVALGQRLAMLEAANGELRAQARLLTESEARQRSASEERDRLRSERDLLAQERDALERLWLSESDDAGACGGQCATCPEHLRDRCVLCVGGRTALLPQYRQLARRLGVRLIHHDGGREEALSRLPELLAASDAVICPTDCVSHPAYYQVKKHCKQVGKPGVLTRNSGLAGFAAALERLAGGRTEIHARDSGARLP